MGYYPSGSSGGPSTGVFTGFLIFGSANTSGPGFRLNYPASNISSTSGLQLFIAPFDCELFNSTFSTMVGGFNPSTAYGLEWFLNGMATGLQLLTDGSVSGNQAFPCPASMSQGDTLECRFLNPSATLNNSPRVHIELWRLPP